MKFSITFKYSNVTFKNKETKETVTYDSKAEGNTFTFDNVDEDVVLGIVKGIKDRKASQVFSYDDFRTNFVNVIARNKCKELYDKLDKGGWKVEDIAISSITIKDLEFTKPTMNARENLTVESLKRVVEARRIRKSSGDEPDEETKQKLVMLMDMEGWEQDGEGLRFIKPSTPEEREFKDWEELYKFVLKLYGQSANESKGDMNDLLEEAKYHINEAKAHTSMAKWNVDKVLGKGSDLFNKLNKLYDEAQNTFDCIDETLKGTKNAKRGLATEGGKEQVRVEFKKTPEDGKVIAFFPDTMKDGSCNPGMIMSYMHVGQHGEASVEFYNDCTTCLEEDYADLLAELEKVYDDCELVVVE